MGELSFLEGYVHDGTMNIVGDPIFIGFLVLIFFGVFVMLQNTRLDHKLAIMVPAALLSLGFFGAGVVYFLLAFFFAGILYLAFMKFINK